MSLKESVISKWVIFFREEGILVLEIMLSIHLSHLDCLPC